MLKRALGIGLALVTLLVAAAPAVAAFTRWRHVTRVSVTLQNGSLPPPYGKAHTTTFATAKRVARATRALNANHIAKGPTVVNNGCAGGTNVTIVIRQGTKRTKLSGYECGGSTFGTIAGNLGGFLKALKLP